MSSLHFTTLQKMYLNAPVQYAYPGITINITKGNCFIQLPVQQQYFHSAHSVHGSIYFKLLDDAAWFAAASLEEDKFLYTVDFQIRFLKHVNAGMLTAIGFCADAAQRLIIAESTLHSDTGELVATGTGNFLKSSLHLGPDTGYIQ